MTVSDAHILVLDDDPDVACAVQLLLRRRVRRVDTLADPAELDGYLRDAAPDAVLLDLNFRPGRTDGAEGMDVLRRLQAQARPAAVIVMTAHAQVALAVEAMKRGASDFITKPWDNDRLLEALTDALARQGGAASTPRHPLMGGSAAMRKLRALIEHVAPTEANVLVLGENGAGKELVARALHDASRRAGRPFLAVDMGSLPEATIESELFGHRRGAFTDAREGRTGRFVAAEGGTLFLDEIGNLPLPSQAKLLTVLERREVTPLGADRPHAIDVRIVSATNLDAARLRDPAVFRPDLLYRLNTIVIEVPPLRARRDDIPALLDHFLTEYRRQYGRPHAPLAPGVLDALVAHDWPGNVRELRHACERAAILARGADCTLADFGVGHDAPVSHPAAPSTVGLPLRQLGAMEKDAIGAALAQARGNISEAARLLGLSRAALYRKLEKHGL